jgi:hypothetical protein
VRADGKEKCKMKMKIDLREKMRKKRGKIKKFCSIHGRKKGFQFSWRIKYFPWG